MPKIEEEFEGNSERRRDLFNAQRMYPFDSMPDDARRKAWEARPDQARTHRGRALTAQWNSIGPTPTETLFLNNWGDSSGRINAVAVSPANPSLILVGAAIGGVWRSTDGGATFAPVSDNHVDLAVGSITFAPSNPNIVYAGMGDKASMYFGSGVLKSTDAGQTWTRISNGTFPAPGRITKVEVDPTDPNRVYVAQHSTRNSSGLNVTSGFWYSTDGGLNWTKTFSGGALDLVRHPASPDTLYVAMQTVNEPGNTPTPGVFKSTDKGLTWIRVYAAPFAGVSNIKLAITPAAPQNVYVLVGSGATARVEISGNEGGQWTNKGSNFDTVQFGYNCYLFVHPANPDAIYVGTRDLWRSTDGGTTYANLTTNIINGNWTWGSGKVHVDQHHLYISPSNPNLMYLGNDGGLWKTTDGGATYQTLNATLGLTMFTSLDLHPTDRARSYGGTQDNGTQRRRENLGWTEFQGGDGGQVVIDPVDPSIVYGTVYNHVVFRHLNHGESAGTEVQIGNPVRFGNDRVLFYPPFVGNDLNSNIYFGTYRVWVSSDRGNTWSAPGGPQDLTNGGFLSAIGVGRSNTNVIYTGSSDGKVSVSTNGGANWTNISAGLPNRWIKSIVVSPTDANTAYLTVSGFLSGHVFKTTNGGASWTDISGNLPDIPTNTLLIDPRDAATLYVGTDIGVFRSATDGNTWETFNSGMPAAIVSELDANANGLIQVATYGRGMYEIDLNSRKTAFDFDGDLKSDLSIFRPSNGQWWYLRSSDNQSRAFTFGNSTDKLVPADFTGDGKTDVATFRPATGDWFVLRSEDSSYYASPFGTEGDIPAPADFDGDGKDDAAVFRPSNSTWYIARSSGGFIIQQFGQAGDVPVVADYDGDAKADTAIYRVSSGEWWINRSTAGLIAFQFGNSTDKPVQGDYTGDGKADVALFRPSTGEWSVLRSENQSYYSFPFGANGDITAPGDFDGDGKIDPTVFRPSSNVWYSQRSTAGTLIATFGQSGDIPVPSAFVR